MKQHLSRRDFVKSSVIASAAIPLSLRGQTAADAPAKPAAGKAEPQTMPQGKIGNIEFSRLILGGNLIAGCAHSRDLPYVATLARQYNTPEKIRQTLELAEQHGINSINSAVMSDNSYIFEHWKNGGKMKWFSQVRQDDDGGWSQIDRSMDQGAAAIHLTGDTLENLLDRGRFEQVGEAVEYGKGIEPESLRLRQTKSRFRCQLQAE